MGKQRWDRQAAAKGASRRFLPALVVAAALMVVIAGPGAVAAAAHTPTGALGSGSRSSSLAPGLPPVTVPAVPVPLLVVVPVMPAGGTHPASTPSAVLSGAQTVGARTAPVFPAAVLPAAPPAPAATPQPPGEVFPAPSGPKGGVARALETAQSYSLLLGLAAVVVVFLAVQGRLDRRDPRLTRASVDTHLKFEDFRVGTVTLGESQPPVHDRLTVPQLMRAVCGMGDELSDDVARDLLLDADALAEIARIRS